MADPSRLADKRVVLVGAGQQPGARTGIGRAIGLLFAELGARLLLVDIDEAGATETATMVEKLGGEAVVHVADIRGAAGAASVASAADALFGGVDVLINSVGILGDGDALGSTEELWDRVLDVTLKGMWLVTKAVLPAMITQRSGSIVNVSSIGALGGPNLAYGISKAGVNRLTQSVAAAYAL